MEARKRARSKAFPDKVLFNGPIGQPLREHLQRLGMHLHGGLEIEWVTVDFTKSEVQQRYRMVVLNLM